MPSTSNYISLLFTIIFGFYLIITFCFLVVCMCACMWGRGCTHCIGFQIMVGNVLFSLLIALK